MNDIAQRVISVIADILDVNPGKINIKSSAQNTRGWDSFATMQFIIGIEKEFDLSIKIKDAEKFTSVERVVEILSNKYIKIKVS